MARLRVEDLGRHLEKAVAPVYLVAGEEPLLVEESLDAIRSAARQGGFTEREVLHADTGFDWGRLREAADSLSLFGDRRLIELRLPAGKPGRTGSQALKDYCAAPPADALLLMVCGRLDAGQREAAWVKAIERAGAMLYLWPVRPAEMPRWIAARLRGHGLPAQRETVMLLAERAEGNLLAAAQEIEKLALMGGDTLDARTVREAVGDSARYDVFDLDAALLAGDRARVQRICRVLREEGEEPVLVLWALAKALRVLAELQGARRLGRRGDDVFRRHRIWQRRQQPLWQVAIGAPDGVWGALLAEAAGIDRIIKGAGIGRPWDELVQLADKVTVAASRSPVTAGRGPGR